MRPRDPEPVTLPILHQPLAPSPDRWPSRTVVRTAWALFYLVVLALYMVPIGAAAGWW